VRFSAFAEQPAVLSAAWESQGEVGKRGRRPLPPCTLYALRDQHALWVPKAPGENRTAGPALSKGRPWCMEELHWITKFMIEWLGA
jgi:hypothetical protein